jgi:methylthioribose-1-phosphate isomerase
LGGAIIGFGMYVAALSVSKSSAQNFLADLKRDGDRWCATRPAAVNLEWALERQLAAILVTGLGTERGLCPANEKGIPGLFPEKQIFSN